MALMFSAEVFSVPTSSYLSHEVKVWIPYMFKRHVLRKRIPRPPQIIEKEDIVAKKMIDE